MTESKRQRQPRPPILSDADVDAPRNEMKTRNPRSPSPSRSLAGPSLLEDHLSTFKATRNQIITLLAGLTFSTSSEWAIVLVDPTERAGVETYSSEGLKDVVPGLFKMGELREARRVVRKGRLVRGKERELRQGDRKEEGQEEKEDSFGREARGRSPSTPAEPPIVLRREADGTVVPPSVASRSFPSSAKTAAAPFPCRTLSTHASPNPSSAPLPFPSVRSAASLAPLDARNPSLKRKFFPSTHSPSPSASLLIPSLSSSYPPPAQKKPRSSLPYLKNSKPSLAGGRLRNAYVDLFHRIGEKEQVRLVEAWFEAIELGKRWPVKEKDGKDGKDGKGKANATIGKPEWWPGHLKYQLTPHTNQQSRIDVAIALLRGTDTLTPIFQSTQTLLLSSSSGSSHITTFPPDEYEIVEEIMEQAKKDRKRASLGDYMQNALFEDYLGLPPPSRQSSAPLLAKARPGPSRLSSSSIPRNPSPPAPPGQIQAQTQDRAKPKPRLAPLAAPPSAPSEQGNGLAVAGGESWEERALAGLDLEEERVGGGDGMWRLEAEEG